jgi:HAD superfamily hydrolase (TIGR01484 family)
LPESSPTPAVPTPAGRGWRPRLVALDIDGTIVDHDGMMPPEVHAAIRRVVDAGVPVVLATGRSWHGTQPVVDLLGLPPGPAVASNGAVIVRYPPLEIVRARTFDPSQVIALVEEHAPGTLIAVEEIGRGYRLSGEFPDGDLTGEMVIEDAAQLSSRPVTRVILRDPYASDQDFLRLAQRLGLHGVTYFVGWSAWLDIAPEGADKASALAEVALELGVRTDEVLALGDGRNDIEMLRWAGRGVAMGDAPPEVKGVADHVTGLFAAGGTVEELQRWFG